MPRKRNSTTNLICPVCRKSYSVNPTRLKWGRGTTCSRACSYQYRTKTVKSKQVKSNCLKCGGLISIAPSKANNKKGAGKYCSRECRDSHWVNVNHPKYRGSPHNHRYGKNWYSTRRAILKRDSNTCQICGVSAPRLHIHHKRPFRLFDNPTQANQHDNLITLCASCHRVEESKIKE